MYNPATGEQTGEVVLGSTADVDRAVETARAAFETWRFSSLTQRQNIMFAFRELVATRRWISPKSSPRSMGRPSMMLSARCKEASKWWSSPATSPTSSRGFLGAGFDGRRHIHDSPAARGRRRDHPV